MTEYKKCPCGAIPTELGVTGNEYKWAEVSCGTCGEWTIEFRPPPAPLDSAKCLELAAKAWNRAPRGGMQTGETS